MMCISINLNDIKRAIKLVTALASVDSDFDLATGRYVVDAKSIMGVLSIDLSKPVDLYVYSNDEEIHSFVMHELKVIGAL